MNGICKQDADPSLLARLLQLLARTRPRAHDPLHAGRLPGAALLQRDRPRAGSASRATAACSCRTSSPTAAACTSAVDLKPSDPIYPCDAVTEQQKPSCYLMQTSYVLQVKSWNLPVAFRICDRVEAGFVGTCYRSMGRDISGAALLDPAKVVAQCALGRERPPRPNASPGRPRTPSTTATRRPMADALCKLARPADRAACRQRPIRPSRRSEPRAARTALVSDVCGTCSQSPCSRRSPRSVRGLAVRATPGQRARSGRRPRASGALSYRAQVVTPVPGTRVHCDRVRASTLRAPAPRRVLEATHRACSGHSRRSPSPTERRRERFSRRAAWPGAISGDARGCPLVPREVRSAWRLTACQTVAQERVLARPPAATRNSGTPGRIASETTVSTSGGRPRRTARRAGRSPGDRSRGSRAARPRRRRSPGAAPTAAASRAREPASHSAGCSPSARASSSSRKWLVCASRPSSRLDPRHAGGRELEAARRRRAASTTVMQLEAEYGVSRSSSHASSTLPASLQQPPQHEVHGDAELAAPVAPRGRGC